METKSESVGNNAKTTPYGKVMGIVENHEQLQAVSEAMSKLGVHEFETLDGAVGIEHLGSEKEGVAHFFLGDMEVKMVQRYLTAVKEGRIVFAAVVEQEAAEQAADMAKEQGASEIVHFGNWVITNY